MSIKEKVGLRIRELRLSHELSQEKFALNIDLDRTYVASVENGKRNISIVNLEKVWKYFEISPSEFFSSSVFDK